MAALPGFQYFGVIQNSLALDSLRLGQWEANPVNDVQHDLLGDPPERIDIQTVNKEIVVVITPLGRFFANDLAAHDSFEHVKNHRAVAETNDVCWHETIRCLGTQTVLRRAVILPRRPCEFDDLLHLQ